ncbi:MAG: VIT1/CCC1 transporter family protein [Patescibacteria group bacterium]
MRSSLYIRNVIFGIEDSLAATVGLLSGIAAESVPHETILLTGFVYVFVEAFSMGIGSFLSEESVQDNQGKRTVASVDAALGGLAMFVSCVVAGFVPVLPYLLLPSSAALPASIVVSLLVLSLVGYVHGRLVGKSVLPRMMRMVLLGGTAILVGVVVGKIFGM